MATFGEIAEPDSRTAWEDWDGAAPELHNHKLQWHENAAAPDVINTLIILEGKYLYNCVARQTDFKLDLVNSIKEVGLALFRMVPMNKYICVIKDYNILLSSEIVELLKPYIIVSNDVIAIQTKPLVEYQSPNVSNQDCLVRTIGTTKQSSAYISYPKLEQPNILSGVSAGVISLREHLSLCGKAVVCYIEYPEEYQLEDVQILLKKLSIIPNTKAQPSNVLNSNLYI